jgi:nucleotide-binding universal stress UspA family protein
MVGVERREALALGAGLSPLGVMGVVVAIIGLNTGVFSEQGYTVLVLAAVVTSLLAPLLLRLAVRGWVPDREEAERLERESLIEESEILRATKVLLPTRGGANSEYAARLVALAFGTAEVTVLAIKVPDVKRSFWRRRADIGSSDPESVLSKLGDGRNRVISRVARDPAEAIARESRLGYDILVMGASDRSVGGTGGPTTTVVDRVVGHTGVPTIVLHAGEGAALSPEPPRRILVPITASRSTRAAEEFAYSLARATRAEVTALHVINRPDGGASYAVPEGEFDSAAAGAELARTAAEFGLRLGVAVTTEIRRAFNAEQEIVEYAKQIEADLLVLGASTRPLTRLPFFGHRINYMIERAGIPVAVIAMPSN